MNKRGFSLIELLAVIVVLAIIALIATPIILNVIEKAKISSFKDSVINGYSAVQYKLVELNLHDIPNEGISIQELKNSKKLKGDLIDGKYIKENGKITSLYITNGKYCSYGTLDDLKISKECGDLDPTIPDIEESKLFLDKTSSSIKVILGKDIAVDKESGIEKYNIELYKNSELIDSKELKGIGEYTFTKLTNETEYKIKLIVYNGANLKNSIEKTIKTNAIDVPTYEITPEGFTSESKEVTINYPEGYTNEYSIDGGLTWLPYNNPVVFEENGTIIARVTDGTNYVSSVSQTINGIDKQNPEINITIDSKIANIVLTDDTAVVGYLINQSSTQPDQFNNISETNRYEYIYEATKGGKYYVWVKDAVGNIVNKEFDIATSLFCDFEPGKVWDFEYLGAAKTFEIPCDGTYKLETWGAQGGHSRYGTGAYGGYASGNIILETGTTLSIVVGGQGNGRTSGSFWSATCSGGYNGGGSCGRDSDGNDNGVNETGGAGGGFTIIKSSTASYLCGGGGGGYGGGNAQVGGGGAGSAGGGGGGGAYSYDTGGAGSGSNQCGNAKIGGNGGSRGPGSGSGWVSTSLTSTSTASAKRSGNGFARITLVNY